MTSTRTSKLLSLAVSCIALGTLALPRQADAEASLSVIHELKHDVSPPLRNMVSSTQFNPGAQREAPLAQPTGPELTSSQPDPVAQQPAAPLTGVSTILNFDGQNANDNLSLLGFTFVPPDTNGAVGATQFVQIVNVTYAVYNKSTGAVELGPALMNTIWAGFGGLCETENGGDPVVLYDHLAGRWLISQLAFSSGFTENFQCIAISTTSDATGTYNRYAFPFGSILNDYPKFAVWPDAFYYSANMFAVFHGGFKFIGARACAFDRAAMLVGSPATSICFQNPPAVASLLPSDLDGSTLPPAGQPNFFADIADTTHLNIFQFHVDFSNAANSTFTGTQIPVAAFSEICARAISRACIPEPTPGERVDGIADRLMFRLAYRNFGDHESLVANHTVKGGALAGVRWYEIRSPGSSPFVFQEGTVVDPNINFWMGSIAMDKAGDIALGFSASSKGLFPSVFLAGRVAGNPLGTIDGPLALQTGSGVQERSFHRWGDYSSMAIDPSDDCTFWYTQEYYKTTGPFNWNTRVTSFKFASCS